MESLPEPTGTRAGIERGKRGRLERGACKKQELGFKGDGGPATQAELSFPNAVAEDRAGNLYVIDTGNNRVRKVNAKGIIKTYVGTGVAGFGGDGGPATKAEISDSSGGYVDASDNLLIADSGNQRVRAVNTSDIINTIAGGGSAGDKGPAKKALLSYPVGVAIDGSGNLFIADSGTPVIREVSAKGIITTVAGSGSEGFSGDNGPALKADFFGPSSVAVNSVGDIFIADTYNARVRRVDHVTHKVTTFAGDGKFCSAPPCGDGGQAVDASISEPGSLAVDGSGNVYIADPYDSVIRRVDAQSGIISSVAGDYVACTTPTSPCGDNGSATSANLYFPLAWQWMPPATSSLRILGITVCDAWMRRAESSRRRLLTASTTLAATGDPPSMPLWLCRYPWQSTPSIIFSSAADTISLSDWERELS
jgi:sugar lactone lactonase YvrE